VEKTRRLNEMIAEIAQASNEQSQGIGQINNAVSHMDKVTQSNAALAEETAASSEELRVQAEQVKGAVAELMRMVQGESGEAGVGSAKTSVAEPVVFKNTPVVRPEKNGHESPSGITNGSSLTVSTNDFFRDASPRK
jgi:methyl-accepting chemotaxis protein